MTQNHMTEQDILINNNLKKALIGKCLTDENFKRAFLKNPNKAIEDEFNVQIPPNLAFKVVEDTQNIQWVDIPYTGGELNEEELKNIAGGYDIVEFFKKMWERSVFNPDYKP